MERWLNKIILGDCLDVMREMPDKCVDLVLTDPQYGIDEANGKNHSRGCLATTTKFDIKHWDNSRPDKIYFNEIKRISRNQIIWGGNYFCSDLGDTSCFLVWDKDNGKTDFADCELAWCSFTSAVRLFKYKWQGMLQENMREKERRVHPTQKPVALFEWILNKYSNPDDIILDPFLGSGTTIAACINTGRNNWIGIEKEPDYCVLAEDRIKRATQQLRMFT